MHEASTDSVEKKTNVVSLEAGVFQCKECDLKYKYYSSLLNHIEREHQFQFSDEEDKDRHDDGLEDETAEVTGRSRRQASIKCSERITKIVKQKPVVDSEEDSEEVNGQEKVLEDSDFDDKEDDVQEEDEDKTDAENSEDKPFEPSSQSKSQPKTKKKTKKCKSVTTRKTVRNPFICEECGATFLYAKTFEKHQQLHVDGLDLRSMSSRKNTKKKKTQKEVEGETSEARPAKKAKKEGIRLGKFERTVHKVAPVPDDCRKCGKHFEDDYILCQHLRYEHFEKDRGNVSVKPNGDPETLAEILEAKTKEAKEKRRLRRRLRNAGVTAYPFKCDICPPRQGKGPPTMRCFKTVLNLAIHRAQDHGAETYHEGKLVEPVKPEQPPAEYEKIVCDYCGLVLSKQSLKFHILTYHKKDEKPYICDQCDHTSVSCAKLHYHRRKMHNTQHFTAIVCDQCGKEFKSLNGYRRHEMIHKGFRFACPDCGDHFASESARREHIVKHHLKVMRHQCEFCGRKFWQRGNMGKHIKMKHADGVYHPALFAENDKKDWSLEPQNSRQGKRDRQYDIEKEHIIQTPYVFKVGRPKHPRLGENPELLEPFTKVWTKESKKTSDDEKTSDPVASKCKRKSTIKKSAASDVTSEAAVIEDNSWTLNCNSYVESIDSSHVHEPMTTNIQLVPDLGQPVSFHGNSSYQSHQQPSHRHDARTSREYQVIQAEQHFSLVQTSQSCQYNNSITFPATQSFHQTQILSTLHSSSAALAAAQQRLQDLMTYTGQCKLCDVDYNDLKAHYLDYHRIKAEKVQKLFSGRLDIIET